MRNTLITAFALARCDHRGSTERLTENGRTVLLCEHCGACTLPSASDEETTRVRWKRPDLVARLERDLSDELPIVVLDLEEAERACEEIVQLLDTVRTVADRGTPANPQDLDMVIGAARAWCSAVAHLRRRFVGFGRST
jgi:hypothetical protein